MNVPPATHPTDQTLNDYGLGKLDDSSSSAIESHLETCADCQARLSGPASDTFLARLRDAQGAMGRSVPGMMPLDGTISLFQARPSTAPPPSAESLPPGLADLADYEIRRELGRGGMGVVYHAHNAMMGRDEVLKVMGRHLIDRPGVLERFQREIRAVAQLRHPNIVAAYTSFRIEGGLVLAMEYVEGLDLARLVKAKGPLPVAHAAYFIHQAALGLQHSHEKGMVHRDIKPHNLMLTHNGKARVVKLLDFGLAKASREQKPNGELTLEGQALGTPDYIAPEQILDAPNVDIRADLYSLGGTLFYLLTGRPPFQATSLYDMYQAHISREAEPLNLLRPDVPAELAALVSKMMAKDPSRRFQTPGEVAQALVPFFKPRAVKFTTEESKVGSAELRPLEVADQPPTKSVFPTNPTKQSEGHSETKWDSLIDFRKPEPVEETPIPAAKPVHPRWLWPVVTAASVMGIMLIAWLVWDIKVKTSDGTIILKNVPKDAVVTVDGQEIVFSWPGENDPWKIKKGSGQHNVVVTKKGFQTFGKDVTIKKDGSDEVVEVSLVPDERKVAVTPPVDTPERKPEKPSQAKQDVPDPRMVMDKLASTDPVQRGTRWKGVLRRPDGLNWGDFLPTELQIIERKGDEFTGVYSLINANRSAFKLKGKVSGTHFSWELTEALGGRFKNGDRLTVTGIVKENRIDVHLDYHTVSGEHEQFKGFYLLCNPASNDIYADLADALKRSESVAPPKPGGDPLVAGSVWCGLGSHSIPEGYGRNYQTIVKITNRSGNNFSGNYKPGNLDMTGKIDGNTVEMTMHGNAEFVETPFKGVLREDRIDFDFEYKTKDGREARGKFVLILDAGTVTAPIPKPTVTDAIHQGTQWKGALSRVAGDDFGDVLGTQLRISRRDGADFEGRYSVIRKDDDWFNLKGKITDHTISWEMTEGHGRFSNGDRLTMMGNIMDNRIDVYIDWHRVNGEHTQWKGYYLLHGAVSNDIYADNRELAKIIEASVDPQVIVDPLPVGTIWSGLGAFDAPAGSARDYPTMIRIKKREGKIFEGSYETFFKPVQMGMKGTIEGDQIVITLIGPQDFAGVPFKGVIRGDRIDIDFAYNMRNGQDASGKLLYIRSAGTATPPIVKAEVATPLPPEEAVAKPEVPPATKPVVVAIKDEFQAGTVWKGAWAFDDRPKWSYEIEVKERTESSFKAEAWLTGLDCTVYHTTIDGAIRDDEIEFKETSSSVKSRHSQSKGKLGKDKLEFTFDGNILPGKKTRGVGKLSKAENTVAGLPKLPSVYRRGFTPLFNGQDMRGWEKLDSGRVDWKVTEGGIVETLEPGEGGPSAVIFYKPRQFGNFRLRMEYRSHKNKGALGIRESQTRKENHFSFYDVRFGVRSVGDQALDGGPGSVHALIKYIYGFNWNGQELPRADHPIPAEPGEWHLLEVEARGNRIVTKLNGQLVTNYVDPNERLLSGNLSINSGGAHIQFRDVMIQDLTN